MVRNPGGCAERGQAVIEASVVICAYTMERWDDLNAAVASVRDQTQTACEIILVIDGNPELQERAEREIEGVTVVSNNLHPGLCGGRMTGAGLARGQIIVFLDDDARADPRWLEELLLPYSSDRVLGVGGHIAPFWRADKPSWLPEEFYWVIGSTWKGYRVGPNGEIRNMTGANMSVRADVLRQAGGFTAELGRLGGALGSANTCDDTEFCIRAKKICGGEWIYRPQARVEHSVPASRTTWKYFVHRCRMEGHSKAVISDLIGTQDGLASERRYVFTLAGSVLGYMVRADFGKAFAVCYGLGVTTFAYLKTKRARARQGKQQS